MKKLLVAVALLFTAIIQRAEAQSTCFDIQSILVDACGTPEGENEMVSIVTAGVSLNTSTLSAIWPNGSWLGVCSNAQTAATVATLNNSIQSCGLILEPVGGVIPANSKAILVTSTNMNPAANSFSGLSDTLYMVFQCAGNTAGHFKNYSAGSGTRTLIMQFGACADTVTYVVDSLIDQSGLHTAQDGATVTFSSDGEGTYTNPGCQAPVTQLTASITSSATQICPGDSIQLQAVISSLNYSGLFWTGGAGLFTTQGLNTVYISGSSPGPSEQLYLGVIGLCNDTIFDTLFVTYPQGSVASITASGSTNLCTGDSVLLTASAGSQYLWSTGATTPSITVNTAGNFIVTVTGSCGTDSASQAITSSNQVTAIINAGGPTTFCNGDSVTLTAVGGSQYLWSNGATTSSIAVYNSGNFIVTVSNSCGNDTASALVTVNNPAQVSISASGPVSFCTGDSVTLTALGTGSYLWSDNSTSQSITVFSNGSYSVTLTGICGNTSAAVSVSVTSIPVAAITASDTVLICSGASLALTATGGGNYLWSTGSSSASITVSNGGNYIVIVSNSCGSSNDSVVIITDDVVALASANPISGNSPLTVNFTNQSTGAINYLWNFPDNSSTVTNPSYIFTNAGVQQAQLIAYSYSGCTDTLNISIEVIFEKGISIPNIFTPNNDDQNDLFIVTGTNIQSAVASIFNRWGKEIVKSDLMKGWNGKNDGGKQQEEGTYFYQLKVTFTDGVNKDYHGAFSLYR